MNSAGREEREERRTGEGQPCTAGLGLDEFLFEEFIVLFQSVFGLDECEGCTRYEYSQYTSCWHSLPLILDGLDDGIDEFVCLVGWL